MKTMIMIVCLLSVSAGLAQTSSPEALRLINQKLMTYSLKDKSTIEHAYTFYLSNDTLRVEDGYTENVSGEIDAVVENDLIKLSEIGDVIFEAQQDAYLMTIKMKKDSTLQQSVNFEAYEPKTEVIIKLEGGFDSENNPKKIKDAIATLIKNAGGTPAFSK